MQSSSPDQTHFPHELSLINQDASNSNRQHRQQETLYRILKVNDQILSSGCKSVYPHLILHTTSDMQKFLQINVFSLKKYKKCRGNLNFLCITIKHVYVRASTAHIIISSLLEERWKRRAERADRRSQLVREEEEKLEEETRKIWTALSIITSRPLILC